MHFEALGTCGRQRTLAGGQLRLPGHVQDERRAGRRAGTLCLGPALRALGVPTEIAPRTPALAIRDRISEGPKQADSRCEHACTRLSQSPPATLAPCPSGSITWPAVGTSGAQPATRPTEPPESPARSLVHFSNTWLCCGVLLKAQMKLCYPCDCSKV